MKTVAVLPVKRFELAKQRLAPQLSPQQRKTLMESMAKQTVKVLLAPELRLELLIVTAEPSLLSCAELDGVTVIDDNTAESHSQAAVLGINLAIERGAGTVLLAAADCPLLTVEAVATALDHHSSLQLPAVTALRDRDRSGTNGLVISPPGTITPSFGPGSAKRHLQLTQQAGATYSSLQLEQFAHDIDTFDDLTALLNSDSCPQELVSGLDYARL